jgi:hypothetical protein
MQVVGFLGASTPSVSSEGNESLKWVPGCGAREDPKTHLPFAK